MNDAPHHSSVLVQIIAYMATHLDTKVTAFDLWMLLDLKHRTSAHYALRRLETDGWLTKGPGRNSGPVYEAGPVLRSMARREA